MLDCLAFFDAAHRQHLIFDQAVSLFRADAFFLQRDVLHQRLKHGLIHRIGVDQAVNIYKGQRKRA
ncbi:hypothetical protein D3C73_1230840 [compost metagenome]